MGGVSRKQWVWVRVPTASTPSAQKKAAITAACERFMAEVLRPRFLPEIRPTSCNYPIAITGKWHGTKYRFVQRFRSDSPDALEPEFDAPFARLECVGPDRFDLSYYRHTGAWWRLYQTVSLTEALRLIETDGHLHPV